MWPQVHLEPIHVILMFAQFNIVLAICMQKPHYEARSNLFWCLGVPTHSYTPPRIENLSLELARHNPPSCKWAIDIAHSDLRSTNCITTATAMFPTIKTAP